uniref:DUF5641 domain-containing protein n=1 Tax=Onchocerca volvulus TaxID=6282 RepID=A0A8R1XNB4_ONCVO
MHSPRLTEERLPQVNEIVLLVEPIVPPGVWNLARIIKLNKSTNGWIRSATIQLANGKQFDRSTNMLCSLEINSVNDLNNTEKFSEDGTEEPSGLRAIKALPQLLIMAPHCRFYNSTLRQLKSTQLNTTQIQANLTHQLNPIALNSTQFDKSNPIQLRAFLKADRPTQQLTRLDTLVIFGYCSTLLSTLQKNPRQV